MYHRLGIDTISCWKGFHPEEDRDIIIPNRNEDQNGQLWFGGLMLFPHEYRKHTYTFTGSLARMSGPDDNNLHLAQPEDVLRCIEEFEQQSGLIISDAQISRLDTALDISNTVRATSDYFSLLGGWGSYRQHDEEHGRYLNGSEKTLVMYDKVASMKAQNESYVSDSERILRLELRQFRHVERQLKIPYELPALTMQTLAEPYGFVTATKAFERDTVRLLHLGKLGRQEKEKGSTPWDFITNAEREQRRAGRWQNEWATNFLIKERIEQSELNTETKKVLQAEHNRRSTLYLREEMHEAITDACRNIYENYSMGNVQQVKLYGRTRIGRD